MAFTEKLIEIPSYTNITLKQSLSGTGSKRLMVLLPGLGYTVHAPLTHFLRNLAWSHGDDVLAVQYGFQVAQGDYEPQHQGEITQESLATIEAALKFGYEDLFIIGKSLGTPMAALFANHFPQTSKAILLTPVQNAHQLIEKTPTLAIIGTADSRYTPELVQDSTLITWQVHQGLNHSLEVPNDTLTSIKILGEMMARCEAFLWA